MRVTIATLIGCLAILISGQALAGCGSCGDGGGCGDGGCGVACDENQTRCQCTDPICNKPWYSDCISRSYCCEAFGNVGAR